MAAVKNEFRPIGLNVLMGEDSEGRIVLVIDPTTTIGPSGSGKSVTVAKTSGNQLVTPDGLMLGVNAYRPLPKQ